MDNLTEKAIRINRDCPEPLWSQVANDLATDILRGAVAGRLPSCEALSKAYGVSMATLRHAMKHLQDQQLVAASRGRGMFVIG